MTWRLIFALVLTMAVVAQPHRYLVELKSDPARVGRELILEEQRRVRGEIDKLGGRVVESTSAVSNTLLVEMAEEVAPKVGGLPDVKRVRASRTFRR